MKKTLFIVLILISKVAFGQSSPTPLFLEIVKTDSTRDFYIFNTKDSLGNKLIILAESEKIESCKPFKKYIVADSVYETTTLRLGNTLVFVGFYLGYINDIRITEVGDLPRIIWNCESFTD